jgi:hypothetical protein
MIPDAFLSIVSKDCKPSELLVRARRPGDIEKIFPHAKVTEYDKSDYQFRAVVTRVAVKASVRDSDLHRAYNEVWGTMAKLQPKAPYSGLRGKSMLNDLFFDDFGSELLIPKPKQKPKLDAQSRKNLKKLTRGQ